MYTVGAFMKLYSPSTRTLINSLSLLSPKNVSRTACWFFTTGRPSQEHNASRSSAERADFGCNRVSTT